MRCGMAENVHGFRIFGRNKTDSGIMFEPFCLDRPVLPLISIATQVRANPSDILFAISNPVGLFSKIFLVLSGNVMFTINQTLFKEIIGFFKKQRIKSNRKDIVSSSICKGKIENTSWTLACSRIEFLLLKNTIELG
jgi:hypothetical protein